jgi:hypothetical protein
MGALTPPPSKKRKPIRTGASSCRTVISSRATWILPSSSAGRRPRRNGITITTADVSENDSTAAGRDPVAGSKNRTTAGATIKALFRKVVKALTEPAADESPKPASKRRGETEGGFAGLGLWFSRHVGPAARGRYAALKPNTAASPLSAAAAHGAGLYLADTLEWLNLWQGHATNEHWQDQEFGAKQDQSYPQP